MGVTGNGRPPKLLKLKFGYIIRVMIILRLHKWRTYTWRADQFFRDEGSGLGGCGPIEVLMMYSRLKHTTKIPAIAIQLKD